MAVNIPDSNQIENEERQRFINTLISISPDILYVYDLIDKRNVYSNDGVQKVLGFSADEIKNMGDRLIELLMHPDDYRTYLEITIPRYIQAKDGERIKQQFRMKDKDGVWHWLESTEVVYRRASDGTPHQVFGIIHDISEQKLASEKLIENEAYIKTILDNLPIGVSVNSVDPTVTFRYYNDTFLKYYRTEKNALSTPDAFWDAVYEDPKFRAEMKRRVIEDCTSGDPSRMHWDFIPITRKGDETRYISAKNIPIREKQLMLSTVWDVTDVKLANDEIAAEKERLLVTLRSIGDGVITTDTDGNVTMMNGAAEALTEWAQPDAVGKPLRVVFKIINENSKLPCEDPVVRVLATGDVVEIENHTILVGRRGTERLIADSGAPIRDHNNQIIGVVLVFRDMTEKQKLTESLLKTQKLESLGVLAGGIAHDFNNLLGGIFGYLDIAGESIENEDLHATKRCIAKALGVLERAKGLSAQLLTFAKGGAPIRKVVNIGSVVEESARFCLSGSSVVGQFEIANDLWSCNCDASQIGQVIDNIVINAKQAMPGGGRLLVTMDNSHLNGELLGGVVRSGPFVRISIKDQGVGMTKDVLNHIFDPFYSTKPTGNGLGLTTVYSIILRHDGWIDVESEPGEGSTFHVFVPASPECGKTDYAKEAPAHKGSGTVLVMDDEQVLRETLSMMLKSIGYGVVVAKNGLEALELYREALKAGYPFHACILDLTIPGGMGGVETAQRIRETNKDAVLIATSGYSEDPVMAKPKEFNFEDRLAKPFRKGELTNLMARISK